MLNLSIAYLQLEQSAQGLSLFERAEIIVCETLEPSHIIYKKYLYLKSAIQDTRKPRYATRCEDFANKLALLGRPSDHINTLSQGGGRIYTS